MNRLKHLEVAARAAPQSVTSSEIASVVACIDGEYPITSVGWRAILAGQITWAHTPLGTEYFQNLINAGRRI